MLLNKLKLLNKNKKLLSIRSFLNTPFPELNDLPKSIDSYEKLHKYSIENIELGNCIK
jgi:hypothetical protein